MKTFLEKSASTSNGAQSKQLAEDKQAAHISDQREQATTQRQLQLMADDYAVGDSVSSEPIQKAENNTGLPDNLKSGMESISGMSLDHVNVHYNSSKPAAVQAHAYAQGSDIHLASGQEKHLPHELGHVVQQMEGRVQPTTSVGGMAVNDNAGLESEATRMGDQALKGG